MSDLISKVSPTDFNDEPIKKMGEKSEVPEDLGFMGELPLDFLAKLFTDLSKEEIERQFVSNGYDFDSTITKLMFPQVEPVPVSQSVSFPQDLMKAKSNQVCRHFAEGTCFRKDCWFRHDFGSTVCKFWLKGSCLNGASCRFSHEVDADTIVTKIQAVSIQPAPTEQPLKKLDQSAFPALSGSNSSGSLNIFAPSKKNISGYDRVVKAQKIKDKLPWVPSDTIQQYLASTWYDVPSAVSLLGKRYPKPRDYKPPSKTPVVKQKANTPQKPIGTRIKQVPKAPEFLPWINTGSTVGKEYQQFREAAAQLARKRNGLFERARSSFLNGKMLEAKTYSLEGQEMNLLMKEQHRLAAQAIIAKRNPKDSTVLDLHCLHVSEAIDLLDETIVAMCQDKRPVGSSRPFYILTGSGHHSVGSQSRLLPLVLDYLDSSRIKYVDCSTDGLCGMLRLNF